MSIAPLRLLWPPALALLGISILICWNLMLRRWKAEDWRELPFVYLFLTAVGYAFFLLPTVVVHISPLFAAVASAIAAFGFVAIMSRVRRSRKRM